MPAHPDEDDHDPECSEDDLIDPLLLAAARALEPASGSSSPSSASQKSPSGPQLSQGTSIAGRYRLDERLGAGGMGEVWAATHEITRRRVALKFLKGSVSMRPDMRQRLLREARAASAVKHPNVVEVLDAFELEGGVPVLVMDLLVGETLRARLVKAGALSVRETAALLSAVVAAIEAAHARGVIHRDLKPDNIFLEQGDGGDVKVKVLDFGVAKLTAREGDAAESGSLTGADSIVGTPWYMAPEQCYGEQDVDGRADVWALGVILYECLAGRRPVEGSSIGQVLKHLQHDRIVPIERQVPGVPSELRVLLRRMLSVERQDRPQDLSELRRVLAVLANGSHPTSSDRVERLSLPAGLAVASVAVAVVVVTGWGIARVARHDREASVIPSTALGAGTTATESPPSATSTIDLPPFHPNPAPGSLATTLQAFSARPASSVAKNSPSTGPAAAHDHTRNALAPSTSLVATAAPAAPLPSTSTQPPPAQAPGVRLYEQVPF
jgi:serine/threonine-protein kinase